MTAPMGRTLRSPGLERMAARRGKAVLERFRAAVIRLRRYANLPTCALDMSMTETCSALADGRAPRGMQGWSPHGRGRPGPSMITYDVDDVMGRAGIAAAVVPGCFDPLLRHGGTMPDMDTMSAFLEHLDPARLDPDPMWCDGAGRATAPGGPRGAVLDSVVILTRLWSAGLDDGDMAMAYDLDAHGLPLIGMAMFIRSMGGTASADDVEAIIRLDSAIIAARGDVMPIDGDAGTETGATSWTGTLLPRHTLETHMGGTKLADALGTVARAGLRHIDGTGFTAMRGAPWARAGDALSLAGRRAADLFGVSFIDGPPPDVAVIDMTLIVVADMLTGDPDAVDAAMAMTRAVRLLSGMQGGTPYGGSTPVGRLLYCGGKGVAAVSEAARMLGDGLPAGFVSESAAAASSDVGPSPEWEWYQD